MNPLVTASVPAKKKDNLLYLKYGAAGGLCCMVTHVAVVPIDVIKTRMQTTSGVPKYTGMISGMRLLAKEEGPMILLQGLGPTAAGYAMQGALKFGFYEYFKKKAAVALGPERMESNRLAVWLGAGAVAEFLGDIALCPMEATRIRLVAQPTFARGLFDGTMRIFRSEGMSGLYKGLPAIVSKQVRIFPSDFRFSDSFLPRCPTPWSSSPCLKPQWRRLCARCTTAARTPTRTACR
jgi:solute carrier family 25 phosphate transporter 3